MQKTIRVAVLALLAAAPAVAQPTHATPPRRTGAQSAPGPRISTDSTFDEFRDRAPTVYYRLSRTPAGDAGLWVRLVRKRCTLDQNNDQEYTFILEFDSRLANAETMRSAANSEFTPILEYLTPNVGNGILDHALRSTVLTDKKTGKRYAVVPYDLSDKSIRDILLDPTTRLRLFNKVPIALSQQNRDAMRVFVDSVAVMERDVCARDGNM
jgi:hypothetical protein